MKAMKRLIILFVIVIVLIGCEKEENIEPNFDRIVSKGEIFKVSLEQNSSSGYVWSLKNNLSNSIISLEDLQIESLRNDKGISQTGASSLKIWHFKASKKGSINLNFIYKRPFENDVEKSKTIKIKIY